ncbi:unnamed protein product [Withania somnifera]
MAYSKALPCSSWKFICLIFTLSLVLGYGAALRSSMETTATTTKNLKEEEVSRMFSEPSRGDIGEKKEILKDNCATRSMGAVTTTTMDLKEEEASGMFSEPSKYYGEIKQFLRNNWFDMLPKGVPIPPSGPSKRHN